MQTTPWKKKKGKQKKRKHFFAVWYRPGKEREGEFVYITLNLWILNYSNMLLDLLFIASLRRLTARRTWKWQEAGEVMGGVAWRRRGKVVGKLCTSLCLTRSRISVASCFAFIQLALCNLTRMALIQRCELQRPVRWFGTDRNLVSCQWMDIMTTARSLQWFMQTVGPLWPSNLFNSQSITNTFFYGFQPRFLCFLCSCYGICPEPSSQHFLQPTTTTTTATLNSHPPTLWSDGCVDLCDFGEPHRLSWSTLWVGRKWGRRSWFKYFVWSLLTPPVLNNLTIVWEKGRKKQRGRKRGKERSGGMGEP